MYSCAAIDKVENGHAKVNDESVAIGSNYIFQLNLWATNYNHSQNDEVCRYSNLSPGIYTETLIFNATLYCHEGAVLRN